MSSTGKGAVFSTLASLASLVAALSCCLPLGVLLMAAGSAGAALFSQALRPWLLGLSVACLVLAFTQTYLFGRCEFRRRRLRTFLLWFSAVTVAATLLAPQFTATLLAGRLPGVSSAGTLRTFDEADFLREFQAASRQTRLVVLISPT
jgi:hypothetical protein